jgi:hypothetical protein
MSSAPPQNQLRCIAKIREAFRSCPRPTPELLSPNGGIEGPYVHKNWGHLTREDVEALDFFGSDISEDITYMSSVAFRYFVPSVMILFLSRPERIDDVPFFEMVRRCEEALQCDADGSSYGRIALTRQQADAFYEWFGELLPIIRKFHLGSFEVEYIERLRTLRTRAKTFTPDSDFDATTIQAITQRSRRDKGT